MKTQTRFNCVLLVLASVALVFTGYREMSSRPQQHVVNEVGCTAEAIKSIDNITERAVQSSKCAQRGRSR
jgi:entry exclusion lipoprotein TrbK